MRTPRGLTVPELLVVLVVVALLAAGILPAVARLRSSALAAAGARQMAVTLQGLRWRTVADGRAHGLYFMNDADGWSWLEVRDGNGNGLRTAELLSGTDTTLSGPHRLEHAASGITLGFPPIGPLPELPPSTGWIDDLDDPIRIGNTNLLAFGPLGTSSSGTLYVTDRRDRLYAIVLYGVSAKVRVWRYESSSGRWTS